MFDVFYNRYGKPLDTAMRAVVDSFDDAPGEMLTMLRYPMGWVDADGGAYDHPTGKRVRPMLLLLCAEAVGGDSETAMPAAVAVELLHNFSLVHDDIQDTSDDRHGRPTVWRVMGKAQAINQGDAMFALSYRALEGLSARGVDPADVLTVWRMFNRTVLSLTRGQHLDISFETTDVVSTDEYLTMIEGKTASLLRAVCEMGAYVGCGDRERAALFGTFGLNIGLAFQIHDDILGIWGDPEATGKSVATDIVSKKKSIPVLYGLAHSAELRALYEKTAFDDTDVTEVVRLLDACDARAYTTALEQDYYTSAMDALKQAQPQGEAAGLLQAMVDALFERAY